MREKYVKFSGFKSKSNCDKQENTKFDLSTDLHTPNNKLITKIGIIRDCLCSG